MNPISFGIRNASEVVDPDGGVDDDHGDYCATRPSRETSRLPSQRTLPRNRRTLFCRRVWINRRSPSSTAARFVGAPLLRIARRIKRSSMSMLVLIPVLHV